MKRQLAIAVTLIAALASPATARDVVVFAAASLKGPLDQLAEAYQTKTGDVVRISYGGSNQLAKQILDGAPADIFISAAVNWMDEVEKAGLLADGSRKDLLGNTLVLVSSEPATPVQIDQGFDLAVLLGDGKLAMAMVDSVPAGQYGKAALVSLGLWNSVSGAVVQADNVRAALAFVARGEAALGIVYGSDAVADPSVHLLGTFPDSSHPPIVYPAARLKSASDPADQAFFAALSSPEARAIFTAAGFQPLQ
jgi:molybdate transport system substrate-binding protein